MESILLKYWGFRQFRPLQKGIIQHVIENRDGIAVIATGGGKSICYQLPALMKAELTLVVSPLVSLMQDQVENLRLKGIKAEAIYSGLGRRKTNLILDHCIQGKIKLLYLAPERLQSPLFRQTLAHLPLSFLAVDEAHCISQWGHDFRPAYLNIGKIREIFPDIPILALTGTATDRVISEIKDLLYLRDPVISRSSIARPNLQYICITSSNKTYQLKRILQDFSGAFIVYTRSRRTTEILQAELNQVSIQVGAYHAGMSFDDRNTIQRKWLSNHLPGIAATTAFGMGIDKADVRLIVHYDLPNSLEEYVQETGRAGRDSQPALCILLSNKKDEIYTGERIRASLPTASFIRQIYKHVAHYTQHATGSRGEIRFPFDLEEFCKKYKLKVLPTKTAIEWIAKIGYIGYSDNYFDKTKVWIKADRTVWEDLQELPKSFTLVFQAILRLYEGVFLTLTPIEEQVIQNHTSLNLTQVTNAFIQLKKLDLIEYSPKGEKGQIWFNVERLPSDNLELNIPHYEAVKQNKLDQWMAIKEYINTQKCRQKFMAEYFDEDLKSCGICDNCLKKRSNTSSIRKRILTYSENAISLEDLVSSFSFAEKDIVINEIMRLEQEQILSVSDDKIITMI